MFLFFFAGLELVEQRVARRSLVRGTIGWAISLAIGIVVGLVLHEAGLDAEAWLLGVALSTTALGTLVPILADAGLLPTPLGSAVLGSGVSGEFWPIVVISIFLTGAYGAVTETLLLVVLRRRRPARRDGGAPGAPAPGGRRPPADRAHDRSGRRAAVRLHPGARSSFSPSRWASTSCSARSPAGWSWGWPSTRRKLRPVRMRLEGVGFGFLIPIYFVVTGMNFDLDSLLTPTGLGLGALFLALFVVVRGTSALLWLRDLGPRPTASLAIFSATGLPLIVAIVGIGTDRGAIAADVGTSLIGAGMVSVLVFPLLATAIASRPVRTAASAPTS